MGLSHIHVSHKHPKRVVEARDDSAPKCPSGFYTAPAMGATVDSLQPLPITWDPTCMDASIRDIDIYLYSPGSAFPRIHIWESVALGRKTYTAELMPRWWNTTASQQLQISIVPAGQPPFMSTFPGGPVFTATYAEPSSGLPASADISQIDSGITPVNDLAKDSSKMNPGKTAAAVILPLLFVALAIGVFIKVKRQKGQDKRKAWTEKVDKRMSTISSDWKSVSAAGANAAIRNSIAVGNRNSSFSFGAIRPTSTYVESEKSTTGVGLRNPSTLTNPERVSRVSFAPDTRASRASMADSRPSGESSRRTRAFHSAYIPPVPALPDNESDSEKGFSPRQTQGALTLTPEDIRSRIGKPTTTTTNEYDEMMPALSMMRTGDDPAQPDDFLFPTPPQPAATKPHTKTSSASANAAMQPVPASVMSPDEMLRAYAERKKSMSKASGGKPSISYPVPASSTPIQTVPFISSTGMRVLYKSNDAGAGLGLGADDEEEEDAYGGYAGSQYTTASSDAAVSNHAHAPAQGAAYPFGHHPNGSIGVGAYGGAQYAIGEDEADDVVGAYPAHGHGHGQGQGQEVNTGMGMAGRGAFGGGGAFGYAS